MSSKLAVRYSVNLPGGSSIELAVLVGEYQGKPTTSFALTKSKRKQDGTYEKTEFFNKTDLAHIPSLINAALGESIVKNKYVASKQGNQQQQSPPPQNPPPQSPPPQEFVTDDDIPF